MVADPSTVQGSINRLVKAGLLSKEIIRKGIQPQRLLVYQPDAVQKLLELR